MGRREAVLLQCPVWSLGQPGRRSCFPGFQKPWPLDGGVQGRGQNGNPEGRAFFVQLERGPWAVVGGQRLLVASQPPGTVDSR